LSMNISHRQIDWRWIDETAKTPRDNEKYDDDRRQDRAILLINQVRVDTNFGINSNNSAKYLNVMIVATINFHKF